jgi:predicted CopG family antitoxin
MMSPKTIALDEESYNLLAKEMLSGETFSETIKRLASRKGSILDYWGMWSEMTEYEVADVRALRSRGRSRDYERTAGISK